MDINKMIVAFKDKKNKAGFNALLLDAFNELGGPENDAVDLIDTEFKKAEIACSRKSIIGKLGTVGVKTIVRPKAKTTKKKDDGPTKKELINTLIALLGISIEAVSSVNNMRKADIVNLTNAIENSQN